MRKLVCLFGVIFLFAVAAAAQDTSKADVFFGYSYVRANPATAGVPSFNLHGGSASLAFHPWGSLGIVGDVGGYHNGNVLGSGLGTTVYTYLFGPRFSYRRSERVVPYVQALFGGAHATGNFFGTSNSRNAFAMTAGGGLDINATRHVGLRLAQVEYFLARFEEFPGTRSSQNNLRLSTGIVFRF